MIQSVDENPRRKQLFSRTLVEQKRLGRTLPSVINGLSAAQAQSQGLIEDTTDADTASANEESLFVSDDSDDDQMHQRSGSASPQKRVQFTDEAPQLNPQAVPFNPFQKSTSSFPPGNVTSPFSTFGKPSFPGPDTKSQSSSGETPSNDVRPLDPLSSGKNFKLHDNSKPPSFPGFQKGSWFNGDQIKSKDPSNTATPSSTIDNTANTPTMNSPNKQQAFPSPFTNNTDKQSSPFAPSSSTSPFRFPGPADTNPFKFPQSTETKTSTKSIMSTTPSSDPPKSIFEQGAPNSSGATPKFSFGTSDLFKPVTNGQNNTSEVGTSSLSSATKANQNPLFPNIAPFKPATSTTPAHLEATITQQENATPKPPAFPAFTPIGASNPTAAAQNPQPKSETAKAPSDSSLNPNPFTQPPNPFQPPTFSPLPQAAQPFKNDLFQPRSPSQTSQNPVSSTQRPDQNLPSSSVLPPALDPPQQTTNDLKVQPGESRSAVLDKLADAVMLGDHGLLQQFIEYTVEPMIHSAVTQVKDEESWKEARQSPITLVDVGDYILTWCRGMSCAATEQEVFQEMEGQRVELKSYE